MAGESFRVLGRISALVFIDIEAYRYGRFFVQSFLSKNSIIDQTLKMFSVERIRCQPDIIFHLANTSITTCNAIPINIG